MNAALTAPSILIKEPQRPPRKTPALPLQPSSPDIVLDLSDRRGIKGPPASRQNTLRILKNRHKGTVRAMLQSKRCPLVVAAKVLQTPRPPHQSGRRRRSGVKTLKLQPINGPYAQNHTACSQGSARPSFFGRLLELPLDVLVGGTIDVDDVLVGKSHLDPKAKVEIAFGVYGHGL